MPTRPGGTLAIYTSTKPGSPESITELKQIKEIGFTQVIAYGSMNGRTLEATKYYLDTAYEMGIEVVFSVKDILGKRDIDISNAEHHRRLFGSSTDIQVTKIAETFLGHPAVKRVFIADEQPDDSEDQRSWLRWLKKRHRQLDKIKPTSVVLYWDPSKPELYKSVKQYASDLQIDYYPIPERKLQVAAISDIGEMLWKVAGSHGYFVVQAFGWDPRNHPEGVKLGFTEWLAPPTTEQMVDMARRAVEGHGNGGAMNLAFFAFGEPNAMSTASMKAALQQICASPWWQSRGSN